MDSKEDDDIPIDFSKIKNFFKRNKEEKKLEEAKEPIKEDEIIIDFSKIKKFFKSDEIEKVKTEHKEEKVSDDELSFDFTKIKKFFKSDEKQYTAEDEVQINWSKIIDFFKKYGIVFIALMPIILSIYVRMQAGFLPIVDDWATNSVINSIKSQISASINQQYPNLPDANKNALVDTELQKFISQNKQRIDQQIRDTSNYFKSFFLDENGKNYMPDIDPYYWYRYAKNIVEHGHPGDTLKDNKPYDDHQLAPVGRFVTPDVFHAYSLAYFYKVMHIFAPNLTLMRSMFYYPIFVSALAVLLVFLIARKISGNLGGFFAGLIMAVNSAFLGRTLFGHADSDAWVVFFPLLITWLFVIIIETKSNLKMIILTIIAGFLTGLYTVAWTGWWYVFDFLLVTIAIEFIYLSLVHLYRAKFNIRSIFFDRAIRNVILIGLIYFLSTTICVTLISGWDMFRGSFLGPLNFPSIKAPVSPSLWPNVLTTVAELNEGSINSIINSIGGQFLFLISLFGLIFAITRSEDFKRFDFVYIASTALFYIILFIRFGSRAPLYQSMQLTSLLIWILLPIFVRIVIAIYKKDITYDFKLSILLSLWIASTIFASIKGIRFTLLMAPAFSVAFGVALGKSYVYLSRWFTKELKIHKAIGSSILIILFLLIYVSPIRGAIASAGSDIPIVNDAWYNALINIKNDSKEDAIITSWWDFGHHFKAIADRRVTFDGTTQTHPAAHWVGRLFMTDNEQEAIGILRMLDCGSNNAYKELYSINNDTHLTLRIIKKIILLDKKDAQRTLRDLGYEDIQIEKILLLTHCEPPEAYLISSEDMIGKSGVWSHFGSWSFERADIWQNARKMPKEKAVEYMINKFNYTQERAENIYFDIQTITSDGDANTWIAPWPGYGGTMSCYKNNEGFYQCSNGFQINLSNYDIFAVAQQGIVRPRKAAFPTFDGLLFKDYDGNTADIGFTIVPKNENELMAVISSKELTGSIFTRTFYMQGHGLKYFKLFDHQRGLTGTDIYTYKVDWQGKNTTIIDVYKLNTS